MVKHAFSSSAASHASDSRICISSLLFKTAQKINQLACCCQHGNKDKLLAVATEGCSGNTILRVSVLFLIYFSSIRNNYTDPYFIRHCRLSIFYNYCVASQVLASASLERYLFAVTAQCQAPFSQDTISHHYCSTAQHGDSLPLN